MGWRETRQTVPITEDERAAVARRVIALLERVDRLCRWAGLVLWVDESGALRCGPEDDGKRG